MEKLSSRKGVVGAAGLEPALIAETDFESPPALLFSLDMPLRETVDIPGTVHESCEDDMGEWQTIDSAPMDGTEIIGVYVRKYDFDEKPTVYGPWTVAWSERGKKWMASWDDVSVIAHESWAGTDYKEPDLDPTHWMPLPPEPNSEG